MGASSPRDSSGSRSGSLHLLGLNKHRDNSTSIQTETAVSKDTQDRGNLAGVASHTHKGLLLGALCEENLTQSGSTASVLSSAGLGHDSVPQLVVLGETLIEGPAGEQVLDVALAAAVVAGVDADTLAEELLDQGSELRGVVGQVQAVEGVVGALEGAGQRGGKVVVGGVDVLLVDLLLPEVVCDERLVDAVGGQGSVVPGGGAVAVELGPVALDWGGVMVSRVVCGRC